MFFSHFFTHFSCYYSPAFRHINFVSNQKFYHIFVTILLKGVDPILNVVEALLVADVVHEDCTVATFVVVFGQDFKSFLACCVENLNFDRFIVQFDYF